MLFCELTCTLSLSLRLCFIIHWGHYLQYVAIGEGYLGINQNLTTLNFNNSIILYMYMYIPAGLIVSKTRGRGIPPHIMT